MGTPDYAASQLEWLVQAGYQVVGCVSQPDRPAGRGRKLTSPSVKVTSDQLGIPCLQPEDLQSSNFHQDLKAFKADLFVVVAYSILPQEVLAIPPKGSVNLHTSLLPLYRGAAPIQWSVLNGDHQTGLTVFQLDEKMDHGPVLVRDTLAIEVGDSSGVIFNKMIPLGQKALASAIDQLQQGSSEFEIQDHSHATRAPKLFKEMGDVDWSWMSRDLIPWINGLNPWPMAYSQLNGKSFKLHRAIPWNRDEFLSKDGSPSLSPGKIAWGPQKEFLVACQDTWIEIQGIQPQGKKCQSGPDIFNGLADKYGQTFKCQLDPDLKAKILQLQTRTKV